MTIQETDYRRTKNGPAQDPEASYGAFKPNFHYGPSLAREPGGGHLQTSEDVLGIIGHSTERFTDEDRAHIDEYSQLLANAYVTRQNGFADDSLKAEKKAAIVFSKMSEAAQRYVVTDRFESLVWHLSCASRLESY